MPIPEDPAEIALRDFVLTRAPLGIYDPFQPRRARVPVQEFTVEFLEVEAGIAHAAGPVVLRGPAGDVEKFLRISVPWDDSGVISPDAPVRAAYIEETDTESGACKETAALANA